MKEAGTFTISDATPVVRDGTGIKLVDCTIGQEIMSSFSGSRVILGDSSQLGPIAIKIQPAKRGVLREWEGLSRAYSAGIVVPQPICLATSEKGGLVLISRRITGRNLYSAVNTDNFLKLGTTIKDIQDHVAITGEEWALSGRADFSYFEKKLDLLRDKPIDEHVDEGHIKSLLNACATEVGNTFPQIKPVFTHHDIHNDQVLVTKTNEQYLMDFEHWIESHPFHDIATYLFHTLRTLSPIEQYNEVLRGYSQKEPSIEKEQLVILFFLLLAAVNSVEFYRNNRREELPYAVEYLRRSVKYAEKQTS